MCVGTFLRQKTAVFVVLLFVVFFALASTQSFGAEALTHRILPRFQGDESRVGQAKIQADIVELPLSFITNAGQADANVRFMVKAAKQTIFFTSEEVVFAASEKTEDGDARSSVVRLRFTGANGEVEGEKPLSGIANFFLGNNPEKWQANVPTYAAIIYQGLYPDIDLIYSGKQGRLKSEFVVAAGADPTAITMTYSGASDTYVQADGALVLETPIGELVEASPLIYQMIDEERVTVEGGYRVLAEGKVGFTLGDYVPTEPLIIDPVLVYSTYLGGSLEGSGMDIAMDTVVNVYVIGRTCSTDFPVTPAAFQSTNAGSPDIFVAKFADLTQFDVERIVFASWRDGNAEIYAMNPDGTAQTNLSNNPTNDLDPSLLSDGSKIAFESWRDGSNEICVMNSDGTGQTNLTNNPAEDYDPSFSPDGSKIAFTSNRDGNWEIYVMNADGSNPTNITNNPADDRVPFFSPDGSKIAFASNRDSNWEIYVMNADGGDPTNLTNNSVTDYYPCFSPNGLKIAFTSYRDGNGEIYIMNADGSNQINLTNNPTDDQFTCSFSPDSSKIAFTSGRDGNWEIYVMNVDGGNQTRLTYNSETDRQPSWGPWTGPVTGTPAVFRVDDSGNVLADQAFFGTSFRSGAADVAEWVPVSEPVEPGDVLELDPGNPGHYRKSRSRCSTLVSGVVSTQPGVALGTGKDVEGKALLALLGIVPVRVTDEGGPIQPGDLLVTSSTPGHAMRWDPGDGSPCALVGKALERLEEGSGTILVLLTAH